MHMPSTSPSLIKNWFISIGIALLIMLCCWIWLQINFTLDIEAFQVKTSSLIKKALTSKDTGFVNEFVFIDISGNKQLVPRDDGSGNDIITNRTQLDTFFRLINRNPCYRYILCDVFFEKALPGDSSFRDMLAATPRLIIPENETEEGIQPALFTETEQGLTSYSISSGYHASGDMIKYPLLHTPAARSIPLIMYERITGRQSASMMGLLWQNGQVGFNHFIPSFRIEPEQLNVNGVSKVIPLNYVLVEMAYADSTFFNNHFRDKYLVIGDFKTDSHSTVMGVMPGPLVLANIFLALREGDNKITIGWLLYVWGSFSLLAFLVFFSPPGIKRWEKKQIDSLGNTLFSLEEMAFSIVILWGFSLISYLWLNKHIDVVVPSVLLSVMSFATRVRDRKQKKSNKKNTSFVA
jgi:hypothetical protein